MSPATSWLVPAPNRKPPARGQLWSLIMSRGPSPPLFLISQEPRGAPGTPGGRLDVAGPRTWLIAVTGDYFTASLAWLRPLLWVPCSRPRCDKLPFLPEYYS